MALITAPTPQEVYDEAGHNGTEGLSASHFGRATDAEVLTLISTQILPTVIRRVEASADVAAFPNDFPLSSDVWKAARPTFTDSQIAEEVANQEAGFVDAIRMLAAGRLLERVVTTNEYWQQRSAQEKADGMEMLEAAQQAVKQTVERTLAGQAEGRAGFGVVKINVEPVNIFDELSGVDSNYYFGIH